MPKPSYVYISAAPSGKLSLEITKDLEVASYIEEGRSEGPFRIVLFEEFLGVAAATARIKQLRKQSIKARQRHITRANPEWKDLVPRPVRFGQMVSPLPPMAEDDSAGPEGGVGARVPSPPPKPLVGADAKRRPTEAD